jgi:photosystem II stability/assembly factor-like uncharacterized protein
MLRRILFATVLLLAGTAPLFAGWSPLGSPVQPSITLQLSPNHPELLYARVFASEGPEEDYLWRSEDAGATWRDAQSGLERPVSALAIDPANPRVIWVWTADAQLWRSADAGDTWSRRYIDPGFDSPQVFQLLVDPRRPRTLYRVDYGGLVSGTRVAVSHDAGATFSDGAAVPHFTGLDSIYPRPGHDELVSFDERGLEVSVDGGKTWTLRGQLNGAGFIGGRLAPSSPDVLYGLPNASSRCLGRSDDAGAHWEILAEPPLQPNTYSCSDVAIDPQDPHHVWVAVSTFDTGTLGHLTVESHDGGVTWSQPVTAPAAGVVAAGGETIYTGGVRGSGLFVSRDGGHAWTAIDRGITAGDQRRGLVAQHRPDGEAGRRLLVLNASLDGSPDAAYRSDGGKIWVKLPLQEPRQIVDAGGSNVVAWDQNGIQRSQDGGESWRSVPSAPPQPFGLISNVTQPRYLAVQAFEPNSSYGRVPLWTSDDGGATWRRSSRGLPDACSHIASVDICPDLRPYAVDSFQPGRRWVVVNSSYPAQSRVFLSESSGASWRPLAVPPRATLALAADTRVRNRLLAGTVNGLLVSMDGGLHWRPFGDLPAGAAVHQLIRDESSATWYAATRAHGIFRSPDGGAHWTLLDGAPDRDAPTVAVDPRGAMTLLATFRGQGVWRWTP